MNKEKLIEAEYTFRVEYPGETKNGQFFMLSVPRIGEAPISISGNGMVPEAAEIL